MMLYLNHLSFIDRVCVDSILRLQKRAERVILNAPFNSRSVLELFNTLKWIPFYRESHINQSALVHKRLKETLLIITI